MELVPLLAQVEVESNNLLILGILSLLAGILIFIVPRLLNYVVAAYLVIVGVIWIMASLA